MKTAPAAAGWLAGAVALAVVLVLPSLVPLGAAGRELLQPGIAGVVNDNLALAGATRHPLALLPRAAAAGTASAGAALLLGLAATRIPAGMLARMLAFTVIGVGLLGLAQRGTGAESIYWVSGIPVFSRTPFFGPLVNPNHAGILLAAALPLCMWLLTRRRADQLLGGLGLLAILGGLVITGSRGAVLAAGCAGLLLLGLVGGRRGAGALGLVGLAVVLAVLVVGPEQAAWWVSMQIIPEDHLQDLTGRRLVVWEESSTLIAAAPLLGTGTGSFEDAYQVVKRLPHFSTVTHAHNEPLQAIIEQGVIGGLLWIAAAAAVPLLTLRRCLSESGEARWRSAALLSSAVAVLIGAQFDFPLRIGSLAALLVVLCGVMLAGGPALPPARLVRLKQGATGLAGLAALLAGLAMLSADPEALTAEGEAIEEADPSAAQALYQEAVAAAPLHHPALLRLGRLHWRAGEADKAIAHFSAAAQAHPTLPWPWLGLARLHAEAGDTEAALAAWRSLLTNNLPDNDNARPWLEEALTVGELPSVAARAVTPPRADRLQLAARLLIDAQPDVEGQRIAEQLFEEAIALDERSRIAYGAALLLWERPDEALAQVEGFPPEQCAPARVSAKALAALGEHDDARRAFQRAIQACPGDDTGLERALQRVRIALGEPEALKEAEATLARHPDRHALRRQVLAGLAARLSRTEVSRDQLLPHLEHLLLSGEATVEEAEDYSRIAAGLPPEHLTGP